MTRQTFWCIYGTYQSRFSRPKTVQCYIDDTQIIKDFQYGFRSARSCTHQLLRITRTIKAAISNRQSIGMLALDLKAAFDTLNHDGMVYKVKILGFPMFVIRLVSSFLEDRFFRTRVGSTLSTIRPVSAGVPQGAVMSPSLFNIYVSDIPTDRDCTTAQFADDTATLSQSHRTPTIIRRLQRSGKRTTKYFTRWGIQTNGSKSAAVLFTQKTALRHQPRTKIRVEEAEVEWGYSARYLGVHLDKRLRYVMHIDETIAKVDRMVKMLYPLIRRNSPLSLQNKLILYKSIFRPTICYAAPIWSNCAITYIRRLQVVQSKLLKMMMNGHWRTPTSEVHEVCDIELLQPYLQRLCTQFFEKCRLNINQDIVQLVEGI